MSQTAVPELLLSDLRRSGFVLTAQGEMLLVEPGSKLTQEQRAAIREHKADLLLLVARDDAAAELSHRLFARPPAVTCGPPPEPVGYGDLVAWFSAELEAGRLPDEGPLRLGPGVVVQEPALAWEWYGSRIADGTLKQETAAFLKALKAALAVVKEEGVSP